MRTGCHFHRSGIDRRHIALAMIALLLVAFWLRVYQLGAIGLSEDESRKMNAVNSYMQGDITANAEHPMLLKALMLVSVSSVRVWNGSVPASAHQLQITEEAALRFPNALFGTLTTIPLYLFTESFFGPHIGLLTAGLWATGNSAVSFNRSGKEDTLMVFFTLLAFYFYRRAKLAGGRDNSAGNRFYALSGIAFGLQLASKYIPGYLGLIVLYYHLLGHKHQNQPIPARAKRLLFGCLGVAFLMVTPSILMPSVWHYLAQYSSEKLLQHHGYQFMGKLYSNHFSSTPFGLPVYFYMLSLLIKTPLPVLIPFLAGMVHVFHFPHGPGRKFLKFIFIWWMIPYSLMSGKWLRYGFSYIPYFYMTAALGCAVLWRQLIIVVRSFHRPIAPPVPVRLVASGILFLLCSLQVFQYLPAPLLYVNPLGGGKALAGKYFTPEELYDAGFREAFAYLAAHAEKNSTVLTDADAAFSYYAAKFNRKDIRQISLCRASTVAGNEPVYAVIHEGNRFFENDPFFEFFKKNRRPILTEGIGNVTALRLYRVQPYEFHLAERLYHKSDGELAAANPPGSLHSPAETWPNRRPVNSGYGVSVNVSQHLNP